MRPRAHSRTTVLKSRQESGMLSYRLISSKGLGRTPFRVCKALRGGKVDFALDRDLDSDQCAGLFHAASSCGYLRQIFTRGLFAWLFGSETYTVLCLRRGRVSRVDARRRDVVEGSPRGLERNLSTKFVKRVASLLSVSGVTFRNPLWVRSE